VTLFPSEIGKQIQGGLLVACPYTPVNKLNFQFKPEVAGRMVSSGFQNRSDFQPKGNKTDYSQIKDCCKTGFKFSKNARFLFNV
jgi:hypothetical protein